MKKYTLLLSMLTLLTVTPSVYAIDIWEVAATNINTTIGCRDTIWFQMYSPIPTLENSRGKVVEVTEHLQNGTTSSLNPTNLVPHPDADVWLSEDRYTIYVVIKNLKLLSLDWSHGKGEYDGPFYGIQIFDRFTPKKDNSPDEQIFKYFNMRYVVSLVRYQAGVEEDSQGIVSKKVGTRTYLPFYVSRLTEDTNNREFKERLLDVEAKHSVTAERIFDNRKFLRWEKKGKQIEDIEFSNPSKYPNSLDFTIRCGAITDGIDLTLTPIYSKPIPKWKLTVTTDSTIRHLGGAHYYQTQQWEDLIDWGKIAVEVGYDTAKVGYDTTLQYNLLKDSSDYFYIYLVSSTYGQTQVELPMRVISNVPEFNFTGDGVPHILNTSFYYHPGYDSVHIHFTRAKEVVSVEEEMPGPGLQQLQWQTTADHDILLKTPFFSEPGQIELYTIVGSLIEKLDLSSLQRSSEGTLISTSNVSSGTYLALVKSKNYRGGTVLQVRR